MTNKFSSPSFVIHSILAAFFLSVLIAFICKVYEGAYMSQCDNAHISAIFVVYLLIFIVPQIVIIAHTFIRKMPSPNMLGAICFLSAIGLLVCMFVFFAMRGGGVVFHDKLSDTEYGIAQLYKTFFRYPLVYLFATLAIVYSIYAVQQFLHNKDIK